MILKARTPVVVAMLKAPRAGFVKTRLAREIGAEPAVAIYRRLVGHQMSAIPRGWCVEVHFAPAEATAEMRQWLGVERDFFPQSGDDLGERLAHATAGAFGRGAGMVLVIGGDCPALNEACLRDASSALQSADVVLGPAADGGYYLIGLRRALPDLFRGIPWSSEAQAFGIAFEVPAETIERYKRDHGIDLEGASGAKHHLLPHPSVFIAETTGRVRFAHVNPDCQQRLSSEEILTAIHSISKPPSR